MQQDRGNVPVAVLVEESPAGRSAVEWAAREAGMLGQRLVLVHLATARHPRFGSAWESAPSGRTACLLAEAAEVARRTDPQVQVDLQVLTGLPGRLLERTAEFCLLVAAQQGPRSFAGVPVGSWGAWLAAHARCPVVLVPDGERPEPGGNGPATGFEDALGSSQACVADDDEEEAERLDHERSLIYARQGEWV